MILGIDAGNNEVKVASNRGIDRFLSALGEYRERNVKDTHGQDDIVYEYKGRKGFAGSLAIESDFGGSMLGESKAHEDTLIRVLLALYRNSDAVVNEIVVGQPIGTHTEEEKRNIKIMLEGKHEIIVNGEKKHFFIEKASVAAEGGAAFWSNPTDGLVRIIDVGSGTVNCASMRNKRYFDRDSYTIPFGMETNKSNDLAEMALGIARYTSKKWKKNDIVYLAGGGASALFPHIKEHYPKADLLVPKLRCNEGIKQLNPIYANAVGFLNIGRALYGG